LLGDPIIILNHGDQFTDPGATWVDTATGESGTVKSTTTVTTDADGLFVITYTATNKYGLKASITRDVAVTGISASFDISGIYQRTAGAPDDTAHITKLGRGLFQTDNVGGNVYHDVGVFLIETDSSILIPDQNLSVSGAASFTNATINYTPPITISYGVLNPGYGTQTRTFIKQ
ncbi:MAG: hypothetical protein JWO06_1133, partial [Bacteroidota bacterium]|nr:hypothetical protein [Bacteroidota bacterium]